MVHMSKTHIQFEKRFDFHKKYARNLFSRRKFGAVDGDKVRALSDCFTALIWSISDFTR